jgi:hypothetical protein
MGWNTKFIELKQKVDKLELELWKIQNPPKFKVFDKITIVIICYNSNIIKFDGIITRIPEPANYNWYYDIHSDKGNFLGLYKEQDIRKRNNEKRQAKEK